MDRVTIDTTPAPQPLGTPPEGAKETPVGVAVPDTGAPPQTPPQEQRPAWLPEKFKTAEDLAKAYGELEQRLGSGQQQQQQQQETPPSLQIETPPETLEEKGVDASAIRQELIEKGSLSEGTYETLKKAGLSKEMVDRYIEGERALGERRVATVHEMAGGQESFEAMTKWAQQGGLSRAEIEAFNQAMTSEDEAVVSLAVRGLRSSFLDANGQDPSLLRGDSGQHGAVKPFTSVDEVYAAMRSQEYKTNAAFRAEVQRRMAVSQVW